MSQENEFSQLEEALKESRPTVSPMTYGEKAQGRQRLLVQVDDGGKRPFLSTLVRNFAAVGLLALVVASFWLMLREQPAARPAAQPTATLLPGKTITLPKQAYSPSDTPYHIGIDEETHFWVVNNGGTLSAFSMWSPTPIEPEESCWYSWVAANDEFTDPCSGDKWSLTGEFDVEGSVSYWSNRDLDRHPIEEREDEFTVFFEQTMMGDEFYPTGYGSTLSPLTDSQTILTQVQELARARQVAVAQQSGWFQMTRRVTVHGMMPSETMVWRNWYDLEAGAFYRTNLYQEFDEEMTLNWEGGGINGRSIDLTNYQIMGNIGPQLDLTLPVQTAVSEIEQIFRLSSVQAMPKAFVVVERDRPHYVIEIELNYDPPRQNEILRESVTQEKKRYVFDILTGRLVSSSTNVTTVDGESILVEQTIITEARFVEQLPEEAVLLFHMITLASEDLATRPAVTPTTAAGRKPLENVVSEEQFGVKVSLRGYDVAGDTTVFAVAPDVAPIWGIEADSFPPQQALTYRYLLTVDNDQEITATSRLGRETFIGEDGRFYNYQDVIFPYDISNNSQFRMEVGVELYALHQIVELDLTQRQEGDSWTVAEPIKIGYVEIELTEISWQSTNQADQAQLQIKAANVSPDDLRITCLQIDGIDPWQSDCSSDDPLEFTVTLPIEANAQLHFRTSVELLAPFVLEWTVGE